MKFSTLAIVLCSLLASMAHATPPDDATQAQVETLVQQKLLRPLAKRDDERSRFSRARMAPAERRARVLDVEVDANGATFVRFAVDARSSSRQRWQPTTIVGCAYPARDEVFVVRSAPGTGTGPGTVSDVRDASVLLGKKVTPANTTTCVAAVRAAL
jgi:hypothetical protein